MITLPAHPSHDLNWEIEPDTDVIWYLDFGWGKLNPFDPALLNANILAIEEFIRKIPHAKKIVLAKLKGEEVESSDLFEERLKESGLEKELFSTQLISDYIHRLASVLPDEMEPVVEIEISPEIPLEECVLLYCRRRFEHLHLSFSNRMVPIEGKESIVISLPQDSLYDPKIYGPLFKSLDGRSFKCIPEELLNEHWGEVDSLIIDPQTIGEIGKRMLYGFEAAGGQIISMRGSLGFTNETSLEEFLSE